MSNHHKNLLALGAALTLLPTVAFADPMATEMPSQQHESSFFKPFTGRIAGSKVRLRAAPSVDSAVVRETTPGDMLAIVGEEKGFYAVQPAKGMKGFVFRTFILDNVVEGNRVNVRLFPDIDAPVIALLSTGDKVHASLCDANNKWLEIAMPSQVRFYIAKEYVEHVGGVEIALEAETRREQAQHLLNAAYLYAQAEIQKPFDEIDLSSIHQKMAAIPQTYSEFADLNEKAKEIDHLIEETYVQKKIAFLEAKADHTLATRDFGPKEMQRLTEIGRELRVTVPSKEAHQAGLAASMTLGHTTMASDASITDKMLVWQSLEESLYHLWASNHDQNTLDDFYHEELTNAVVLNGIVEPFDKPVKNRPGDYILRSGTLPVAFLYSTKVNLQSLVGKKVTLTTTPRPNNNFAFPAYFVLSAE